MNNLKKSTKKMTLRPFTSLEENELLLLDQIVHDFWLLQIFVFQIIFDNNMRATGVKFRHNNQV